MTRVWQVIVSSAPFGYTLLCHCAVKDISTVGVARLYTHIQVFLSLSISNKMIFMPRNRFGMISTTVLRMKNAVHIQFFAYQNHCITDHIFNPTFILPNKWMLLIIKCSCLSCSLCVFLRFFPLIHASTSNTSVASNPNPRSDIVRVCAPHKTRRPLASVSYLQQFY